MQMAESNVIREFLVAIGYKDDATGRKKFLDGITQATTAVLKLGAVVEATALAVAVGVSRFASNLEQLGFAAQRTGSSADSLKAFDLAARNFGASIDEAQGSVENLAAFLRNNPGGANVVAGWLGAVGLSARGANGELLQGTALLAQLGKMFAIQRQQGHWFLANQMAGQLGISDKTALAMSTPGFAEELAKQEKRAKMWDQMAAAAHRFMIQLRDLKMQLEQTFLPFQGQAMAALQGLMRSFSRFLHDHGKQVIYDLGEAFKTLIRVLGEVLDWLDAHGDEIQRRIQVTFGEFKSAYEIVKPAMVWVYDQFVALDKATDGWSTKIAALALALKALGATGLITGLLNLGGGLAKAFGSLAGVAVGGEAGWTVAGTAFGVAAATAIGYAIGSAVYSALPEWMQRGIGDAEGHGVSWIEKQLDKFRKHRAAAVAAAGGNTDANANFYDTHWPWDKPPAVSAPVNVTTNVTIHGATDPRATADHVGRAVMDAARLARLNLAIKREFLAMVQ
jgi:hypothetical protein